MKVLAFYSFFELMDTLAVESKIKNFVLNISIKGTILLSSEGINGTIAIPKESETLIKDFLIELGVNEKNIKVSNFDGKRIFNRFVIKIKKEIVTSDFNLTIDEINKGQFIEPEKWDEFIEQEDVCMIDTRNNYEYRLGHFQNALDPNTTTFREFKKYIEENKELLKNKKVAIYCTGGIRCEKAGPLMQKHGIDTYQLKGGILKYLEVASAKNWNGECFVFDYRVAVDKNLQPGSSILCHGCNMPLNSEDTKSPHYKEGFSCHRCYDKLSAKKTRSLTDKREHWKRVLSQ
ncbi:MAG: rhodanese-like domain-containing protein [Proteobacteria bacterium]|nr:rhodanese-like domain-containing protein [Pseudomonadota bacterium]